jgi:nickel-type superoxide dismutase maturation protease
VTWPLRRVRVAGDSMLPTLRDGDTCLVRTTRRIRPGQLVVVERPDRPGLLVVKRVWRREPTGWWVEGDNLDGSDDSRLFGPVPDAKVIGVVVRCARRHLSPDLQRIGLETALRELSDAYRPGMSVTSVLAKSCTDRPASESASTQTTAVYRIFEQGLLNAAVHGHASECSSVVSESESHRVIPKLRDNGVGSPHATPEPGTGMLLSASLPSPAPPPQIDQAPQKR